MIIHSTFRQASTLTQTDAGPVGPVTSRIYWSFKICTGPTILAIIFKEKTLHKIHRQHLFLIYFISIYFKNIWHILDWTLVNKNVPKCLLAVYYQLRSFLLALSHFGKFLLAWGHRTTVSVEPCKGTLFVATIVCYCWHLGQYTVSGIQSFSSHKCLAVFDIHLEILEFRFFVTFMPIVAYL